MGDPKREIYEQSQVKIAEPKGTSEVKKFMEELRAVRNPRKRREN